MCAATTARARMLAHSSPLVRVIGQRDTPSPTLPFSERELAVFRSERHRKPAKQRSHYAPEERAEILQVMRLQRLVGEAGRAAVHGASEHHPQLAEGC
jgi:hypothetical protein